MQAAVIIHWFWGYISSYFTHPEISQWFPCKKKTSIPFSVWSPVLFLVPRHHSLSLIGFLPHKKTNALDLNEVILLKNDTFQRMDTYPTLPKITVIFKNAPPKKKKTDIASFPNFLYFQVFLSDSDVFSFQDRRKPLTMASNPAIPAASKTKMAVASRAKVPEFGIAPIRVVKEKVMEI